MRGNLKILAIILGVLVLLAAAWPWFHPASSWRYRLVLEIETPEGIKSGSSVRQVYVSEASKLLVGKLVNTHVRGEAVAVDLGDRGVLFALMNKGAQVDYGIYIVFEAFPWQHGIGNAFRPEARAYYSALLGKADLSFGKLPTLVRFRDINDPKTVELVDPNDLAKSFGAGVRLKSASIEMVNKGYFPLSALGLTGEPVTTRIEELVPWIEDSQKETEAWRSLIDQNVPVPSGTPDMMFRR
jgi:hypothetical protein